MRSEGVAIAASNTVPIQKTHGSPWEHVAEGQRRGGSPWKRRLKREKDDEEGRGRSVHR